MSGVMGLASRLRVLNPAGGFVGLNGGLAAKLSNFDEFNSKAENDLITVASLSMNFEYQYTSVANRLMNTFLTFIAASTGFITVASSAQVTLHNCAVASSGCFGAM